MFIVSNLDTLSPSVQTLTRRCEWSGGYPVRNVPFIVCVCGERVFSLQTNVTQERLRLALSPFLPTGPLTICQGGTPSTGQQVYIHVIWCIYLLKNNVLDQVWLRCLHMVLPSLWMACYRKDILACVLSRKTQIFWSSVSPLWCILYSTQMQSDQDWSKKSVRKDDTCWQAL